MRSLKILAVFFLAAIWMQACSQRPDEAIDTTPETKTQAPSEAKASHPQVLLQTSMGEIVFELREDLTPVTVENFLRYVDDGFYEGKIFHRVIKGFMVQGGGFDVNMKQAPTRAPIVNEAPTGLNNFYGTIAMARTGAINSATAQFFINVQKNNFLNHVPGDPKRFGYASFGKVVKGMDVVMKIVKVETAPLGMMRDVPLTPVIINKVQRVNAQSPEKQHTTQ